MTDSQDPMYKDMKTALETLEEIANAINESFRKKEARLRVLEVQEHLETGEQLVTPTRFHVKDGCLRKKKKSTIRIGDFTKFWFFLFNDLLVYTTIPNSKGFCKLKYMLPLIDIEVVDIPDHSKPSKAKEHCNMFEIKSNVKNLILAANSAAEKMEWLQSLKEFIETAQKKAATLKASRSTPSTSVIGKSSSSTNYIVGGEGS